MKPTPIAICCCITSRAEEVGKRRMKYDDDLEVSSVNLNPIQVSIQVLNGPTKLIFVDPRELFTISALKFLSNSTNNVQ
jgi:hypothetical protein